MRVIGAHSILYSKDAEADRAFLRDVLKFPNVDVGGGWLIFALPPSEVAIHPGEQGIDQEFHLMVDDVAAFIETMTRHGRPCTPAEDLRWGGAHHADAAERGAARRLQAQARTASDDRLSKGAHETTT